MDHMHVNVGVIVDGFIFISVCFPCLHSCYLLFSFKDGFMAFFDSNAEDNRAQEALEAFMKKAFTYAAVGVVVAGLASMIMKK